MVNSNDIVVQAEQGSVAAIIQVLNEQLSTSGVRVRAVLVRGVLQLLCEAADAARLDRQNLVQRIQKILESLHPKHIRRVRINSRIVKEQQLLWLDEINRDPNSQLLWSEDIILSRQNPIAQLVKTWQDQPKESTIATTATAREQREKRQFLRGLGGGVLLALGLLLVSGLIYGWLQKTTLSDSVGLLRGSRSPDDKLGAREQASAPGVLSSGSEAEQTSGAAAQTGAQPGPLPESEAKPPAAAADPFAEAVRLAEKAAIAGQTASTTAEWLKIADSWQQASQLMGQVLPTDSRSAIAEDRHQLYQTYEAAARSQAQQRS